MHGYVAAAMLTIYAMCCLVQSGSDVTFNPVTGMPDGRMASLPEGMRTLDLPQCGKFCFCVVQNHSRLDCASLTD